MSPVSPRTRHNTLTCPVQMASDLLLLMLWCSVSAIELLEDSAYIVTVLHGTLLFVA